MASEDNKGQLSEEEYRKIVRDSLLLWIDYLFLSRLGLTDLSREEWIEKQVEDYVQNFDE